VKETFNLFQMTSIIQKKAAWFICTFLLQAITIFSFAQKKGQFTITREQMNQVNQITSPAKAILDEILAKDKTGTYVRYTKDLQNSEDQSRKKSLQAINPFLQASGRKQGLMKNHTRQASGRFFHRT
jgi:hypothetical protein